MKGIPPATGENTAMPVGKRPHRLPDANQTHSRRAGNAPLAQCLPGVHEALGLTPSTLVIIQHLGGGNRGLWDIHDHI